MTKILERERLEEGSCTTAALGSMACLDACPMFLPGTPLSKRERVLGDPRIVAAQSQSERLGPSPSGRGCCLGARLAIEVAAELIAPVTHSGQI
jgi:hypothetical protein